MLPLHEIKTNARVETSSTRTPLFGGSNRNKSEAEGLKVYLCLEHHTSGKEAVHNNAEMMRLLREDGQRAFEQNHTREEFMKLFGKNYLED